MHSRPKTVIAVLLIVSLAGCSALSGPLEFSASQATFADAAVEESGYTEVAVEEDVIEREITRAGVTKQVRVSNWRAMYERQIDLGPAGEKRAAVVSVFSTPQVEIAGQGPFNPVADYSNRELVDLVQQQYESMSDVEQVSERQVSTLGTTTTVTKFSAQATLQGGASVDVYLHVTKVEHGDDIIIAIAVHPQDLQNEQQAIDSLLQNIEH